MLFGCFSALRRMAFLKKLFASLIIIVIVLGGVGAAGQYYLKRNSQADKAPAVVRAEQVVRGELAEIVSAPGQIEPRSKVSISARVAARIEAIPVKERDQVKAGDLLIKLDATELEAALKTAEARYAAAKEAAPEYREPQATD